MEVAMEARCFAVLGTIVVLPACLCWGAEEGGRLQQMEQEVEQLKSGYEARIEALEARVDELEGQASRTADETKELDQIKAELTQVTKYLEFQGYFRSGFGVNGRQNSMEPFQAPSAPAKYRLGNEAETYLETTFLTHMPSEITGDDVTFDTQIRLAFNVPHSGSNENDTETSLRETFGIARGVLSSLPTATFWAGQRFYSRYEIPINDFWPRDMSGFGGGLEDVPVWGGAARFSLAWLGGSVDELTSSGHPYEPNDYQLNMNTIDVGLTDIQALGGDLSVFLTLSDFNGGTVSDGGGNPVELTDSLGAAGTVVHEAPLTETLGNTFAAQYGTGAASNFRALMVPPTGLTLEGDTQLDVDGMKRWRVLDSLLLNEGEPLSLMTLLLYEEGDYGLAGDSETRWFSAGIRPVYHFNRYFSLAFEAGADYTDNDRAGNGSLYKLTLAPQITPQAKFLSRPAIRAFVTYAWWSDDFRGSVGGWDYSDASEGVAVGLQLETWW
jgi:maltoporin